MQETNHILEKIKRYKRKYYLHLLIKGLVLGVGLLLTVWLAANFLEYLFRFGSVLRGLLLLGLILTVIFVLIRHLGRPLWHLMNGGKAMSEEEAALRIGKFFPEISDRLVNLIQLQRTGNAGDLTQASIRQKADMLFPFHFSRAVPRTINRPYWKYLLIPAGITMFLLLIRPEFLTGTSKRILFFNRHFVPEAPFDFVLKNKRLQAFRNEDFTFSMSLKGQNIPATTYLIDKDRRSKMNSDQLGEFSYTFENIRQSKTIVLEAAGFQSTEYLIEVVDRPDLKNFDVTLQYPSYLGRKSEKLSNVGNLQVPEGTDISWLFNTRAADSLTVTFENENRQVLSSDGTAYGYNRIVKKDIDYEIELRNAYGKNKDDIQYHVTVIPDQYPEIEMENYQDTVLYTFVAFRGNVTDDYGISRLALVYRTVNDGEPGKYSTLPIPTERNRNQRFYYQWDIDSTLLKEGEELEYFISVWDNDGVNGAKRSNTATYRFKIPDENALKDEMERIAKSTEKNMDQTIRKAKEIEEQISESREKLRSKQKLSWQDEQRLKELLKKKEELRGDIEKMKSQFEETLKKQDRFNKDQNKNIREKAEKLRKLMDELLDEETRKLYQELEELLKEQNLDKLQDNLSQLDQKESNLEKELERTLELFKRLKMETKLEENLKELESQSQKQEKLAEETEDSKNNDSENLLEDQEELIEDFDELKENNKELEELNQDLKSPESLPDTDEEEQSIQEEQQKSKESLEQNQKKKSGQHQRKATGEMRKMQQKMQQMQASQEMEMMMENLDDLKAIMHNLLTLSFDQEKLINLFSEVQQSDPRFVSLGQQQLKIRDDAKIVQDSLLSLSNRVFQIASFVTREVSDMNSHLDKSMEMIRERKKQPAMVSQQFAMTSINNLALLLDDVLQQMMDAMNESMGKGKSKGKKSGPSLSELQEQLNQKIEDLKKSGKQGRQLSEELAKLAAEQERIRNAFKEMQEKIGPKEGGQAPGNGIPEKMEETELDLVNKQLTEETIKRQKEIMTRMLEAEDALRERDQDEQRKAETAKEYEKEKPKAFEDYFKLKEQEIELLRTIPPKLYPYYKKEVNDYFKRLGNKEGGDN